MKKTYKDGFIDGVDAVSRKCVRYELLKLLFDDEYKDDWLVITYEGLEKARKDLK